MRPIALMVMLAIGAPAVGQSKGEPVIDMHMHAWSIAAEFGGSSAPDACLGADGVTFDPIDPAKPFTFNDLASCTSKLKPSANDAALLSDTLKMMDRYNIVRGVISGDRGVVAKWRAAA